MKRVILLLCLAAAAIACGKKDEPTPTPTDQSKDPVVTAQPPKVVSTVPEAGAVDAPAEGEIKITYDKEISLASKTTISINGVYYDDAVYVSGKDLCIPYALSLGSPVNVKVAKPSVKDKDGTFAEDFTLSFKIVEADQPSDDPSEDDPGDASEEPSDFDYKIITFEEELVVGNWSANKYIEPEEFDGIYPGCGMSIYYKDASVGAQMCLDTNSEPWRGIEDNEGNSYHIVNIPDGNSHLTIDLDQTLVATLKETGLIIGGQFFTACFITLFSEEDPGEDIVEEEVSEDPGEIELEDVTVYNEDKALAWGAAWVYLEPSIFSNCVVGSKMSIFFKGRGEGSEMGLFSAASGWPALLDGNGSSYSALELPEEEEGSYVLELDQTMFTTLKGAGLVIGGKEITVDHVVVSQKKN